MVEIPQKKHKRIFERENSNPIMSWQTSTIITHFWTTSWRTIENCMPLELWSSTPTRWR